MQAYVEGVSTRRVDDVAQSMGIDGMSKSQVSRICQDLDEVVASWQTRPLDAGPYPFVWIDGLVLKVRVVNTSALLATAVDADGPREVAGFGARQHRNRMVVDHLPTGAGRMRAVRRAAR